MLFRPLITSNGLIILQRKGGGKISSFVLHGFAASKNLIQCSSIAYQIRTSATKNVMSHLSLPACRLLFITSDREALGDACGVACLLEDVLLTKIYVTYMHIRKRIATRVKKQGCDAFQDHKPVGGASKNSFLLRPYSLRLLPPLLSFFFGHAVPHDRSLSFGFYGAHPLSGGHGKHPETVRFRRHLGFG